MHPKGTFLSSNIKKRNNEAIENPLRFVNRDEKNYLLQRYGRASRLFSRSTPAIRKKKK